MPDTPQGESLPSRRPAFIERKAIDEIVDYLHTAEAAWVVENARREGVPEYAADRLAEEIVRQWGDQR